jgi:hypothetical protein
VRDIDEATEEPARSTAARASAASRKKTASAARDSVAARLATPEGLRDAMVLREIFGPPRSMQPLEPHRVEMI